VERIQRHPQGELMAVVVRGVEVLERAGRALRGADRHFRREMYRGLNRAAKPLKHKINEAIPEYMPDRGGYAATLQRTHSPRTKIKTGGRDPSIRLVSRTRGGRRDTAALEEGRLAHPVFGNRSVWRTTDVRPGFFTTPILDEADAIRGEMLDAIEDVHRRIVAEI
jgi:hypothetical protein